MKKIFLLTLVLASLSVFAKGGGSFSSGRSSFSSPSRSSSFSGSSRSSGSSSSGRSSGSSSSGKSWFSGSSRSSGTTSKPTTGSSSGQSKPFTQSSRGMFGGGSATPTRFSPSGKTIYSAKSALDESPVTVRTSSQPQPISVYHYYYPTYYYGSGYSWYHYYFYYHMFGNHSYCYHSGGGYAQPRVCAKIEDCAHGETCDLTKKQCVLRTGEWEK